MPDTQYNSVLLRQNLEDTGSLPRTGGWTASPDLIAAGTTPITDPQTTLSSAASYASDPTQPVVFNASNYIYLRGKNLGASDTTAEARAFYAPQSLFLYPSQWLDNGMQTQRGATVSLISSIAAGAIGVTTDPFVWQPSQTTEHYCMVGFISTPADPFSSQKPPNAVSSLDDLAAWIGRTGGTGWHNVQFSDVGAPTFTKSSTYPASSTAAKVRFSITCTGLPANSQVSFSCSTPLPNGQVVNLPKTTVPSPDQIGFFVEYDVPANWTSPISYSYYSNNGSPLPTFSLAMSASVVDPISGNAVFSKFTRPAHEVFPNHHRHDHASNRLVHAQDMPVNRLIAAGSDITLLR